MNKEQILDKIEQWPHTEDFSKLMDYVCEAWEGNYGKIEITKDNDYIYYRLVTGGWSENEYIIEALMDNRLFWIKHWYQSTRGGEYKFIFKKGVYK